MGSISPSSSLRIDPVVDIKQEDQQTHLSRDITKPTKWLCAQRRLRSAWVSAGLGAQRRLRSDWADAQADLSLRWAHIHFVGFVLRRLLFLCKTWQRCRYPSKRRYCINCKLIKGIHAELCEKHITLNRGLIGGCRVWVNRQMGHYRIGSKISCS